MTTLQDLLIYKKIAGGGGGEAVLINKDISANGTYYASTDHADGYKKVVVDVQPSLTTKTITDNGTYAASSDNADGYSSVTVTVPEDELLEAITLGTVSGNIVTDKLRCFYYYMFESNNNITGAIFNGNPFYTSPMPSRESGQVFRLCTGVRYIIVPFMTSYSGGGMGSYCFSSCNNLSLILIKSTIMTKGSIFTDNPKLKSFIMTSDTLLSLGNANSFNNTGISAGTGYIYVPDSLKTSYQNATNWSTYSSQIKSYSDADAYSSGTTYSVGDVVKHNNKFYAWINLTDGNTEPTGTVNTYGDWYCVAEITTA